MKIDCDRLRLIVGPYLLLLLAFGPVSATAVAAPPELMLANRFHDDLVVADYWVSEKYDGVRAYWDGHRLISRGGHSITVPLWFTYGFPETPLDGELWMGRGRFEETSGAIRRRIPENDQWQEMHYMVFDMPTVEEPFTERIEQMRNLIEAVDLPHLQLVEQTRVNDRKTLMALLHQIVTEGGEGLMLHHGDAPYRAIRSDDLVKLKPYQDGEAVVVAHLPGKGRLKGMVGSLLVEIADGARFRIGSGLSDAERKNPPPIGSTVTYKHHGLTNSGLPRFATYLRQRDRSEDEQ